MLKARPLGAFASSTSQRASALALGTYLVALRLVLPALLPRTGLRELLALLTPTRRLPSPADVGSVIARAEHLLRRVGRGRLADTCLYRSLARYAVLRSAGIDVRFLMGVRTTTDDFAGHAWLERDGQPYLEPDPPEFVVTFAFPHPPMEAS